jgi:hypothetical protein
MARAVSADDVGVYVAGIVEDALPGQTSAGSGDVFVRRYESSGTATWTRQFGSPVREYDPKIAAHRSGVVVVGSTDGVLLGQTGLGNQDLFVTKLVP